MEFRRCMPPCTRFIAREDPHSKCILCLCFSHAREAVYGTSNCKICDDFRLITLRSRLEDYERESSKFSRHASSTNAPPHEIAVSREAAASRRAASWGSDVELEEMESEQTGLAFSFSLSLSPSLPLPIVRIRRLNFCLIFSFLAQKHVISSLSG